MRKWMVMLFIGPGLFFIFYWLLTQGNTDVPIPKTSLPKSYKLSGQMVAAQNGRIKAGLSGRTILIEDLVIGNNNRVMVEAGKVFLVIPVFTDSFTPGIKDFELIDARGIKYLPLEVKEEYIAQATRISKDTVPKNMTVLYLLFKVKMDVEEYYLLLHDGTKDIAWYFNLK
ncbi:MAG: hypothetical protein FH756_13790 [Firmicutes bacterium]|nr:hypothetical protein [Bacillota bacterium]